MSPQSSQVGVIQSQLFGDLLAVESEWVESKALGTIVKRGNIYCEYSASTPP